VLLARHPFAPHHAPALFLRCTRMTTSTAAAAGEYPITRALTPDLLVGSGVSDDAFVVGQGFACLLDGDLVPAPHVLGPVLPVHLEPHHTSLLL